MYVVLKVV